MNKTRPVSQKIINQIGRSIKNMKKGKVIKVDINCPELINSPEKDSPLTFKELRQKNRERCETYFHPLFSWSPSDWACALAGEVGECCDFIKKIRRGDKVDVKEVGKEIADVIMYADLLASRYGFSLEELVRQKFNEVSDRKKCKIKL